MAAEKSSIGKSWLGGLRKACTKRPIPSRTVEKMVEDIEAELYQLGQGEVPSSKIGEMVWIL